MSVPLALMMRVAGSSVSRAEGAILRDYRYFVMIEKFRGDRLMDFPFAFVLAFV